MHVRLCSGWRSERLRVFEAAEDVTQYERDEATVVLNDGKRVTVQPGVTTPFDLLVKGQISSGYAAGGERETPLVAEVDGRPWDLQRAFEKDCRLTGIYGFSSTHGKSVLWHSSAHLLGAALEEFYCNGPLPIPEGGHEGLKSKTVLLDNGPAVEKGYFYDCFIRPEGERKDESGLPGESVGKEEVTEVQKWMKQLAKRDLAFERKAVAREVAEELFSYNRFKRHSLQQVPTYETVTLYRVGDFVDLCRGPHVPSSKYVRELELTHTSSVLWREESVPHDHSRHPEADTLQRIYGIAFPDKAAMKTHKKAMARAEESDHRRLGKEQSLFLQHPNCPGSPMFLPHGTRILNALQTLIREEYHKRGYDEVITPTLYHSTLWRQSGHWDNYKEHMYTLHDGRQDDDPTCLKPMNCPAHCLLFGHAPRSYRELPIRYADFGTLHRNELEGALSGLTRVRRFHQDDGHVFCREDQIEQEVDDCLDFMQTVYGLFGFNFSVSLSTRPEKFLGEVEAWDRAEKQLMGAIERAGMPWSLKAGDGAFYGPKIDVTVLDAHHREHQCATIQLDFQLPLRFDLKYHTSNGSTERPVIVHRAVLGSLERMFAVIIEHYAGSWPLWLSPRQVLVCSVSNASENYAKQVKLSLRKRGLHADEDTSDNALKKKIKDGTGLKYNYVVVVGDSEAESNTVTFRERGSHQLQKMRTAEFETLLMDKVRKRV